MVKDISEFDKDMHRIMKRADDVIMAKLLNAAETVRGNAVKSIQASKFGRDVVRYTPAGSPYNHVSAPEGSPPNTDTGNLVKNIIAQKRGQFVVVGSSEAAPYGKWLELGNERGQKWEWLKPAVEKSAEAIRKKLKEVGVDLFLKK